jgi:hypothetical protein
MSGDAPDVLYASFNGRFEVELVDDDESGRIVIEFQTWTTKPDDPTTMELTESYTLYTIGDAIGAAAAILERFAPHRLRR